MLMRGIYYKLINEYAKFMMNKNILVLYILIIYCYNNGRLIIVTILSLLSFSQCLCVLYFN